MTPKILSWTTFGLLVAGAFPFVSNASVAPGASAGMATAAPMGITPQLPPCGACRTKPDEEYFKEYAIDRNSLCPPAEPYRAVARMSVKVICENGSYWVCYDTSTMGCEPLRPRPECPNDSCQRTK